MNEMNEEHTHCGCNGTNSENHQHGHGCCKDREPLHEIKKGLQEKEIEFLMNLAQTPYLPLGRFLMKSSKSSHLEAVAMAPVYLNSEADSMEFAKDNGLILKKLQDKGLVTLDYEIPLQNGNYTTYSNSSLFRYFTETVEAGAQEENFIFDIAELELGSIALTFQGQALIKEIEKD